MKNWARHQKIIPAKTDLRKICRIFILSNCHFFGKTKFRKGLRKPTAIDKDLQTSCNSICFCGVLRSYKSSCIMNCLVCLYVVDLKKSLKRCNGPSMKAQRWHCYRAIFTESKLRLRWCKQTMVLNHQHFSFTTSYSLTLLTFNVRVNT